MRLTKLAKLAIPVLCACACAAPGASPGSRGSPGSVAAPAVDPDVSASFGVSTPAAEGMDAKALLALAQRLADEPDAPLFSILISRHGKLVFEAYTGPVERDQAHYLMSVTKSVLSALVGIAIDRRLIRGPDETVAEALPPRLFGGEENRQRFRGLSLHDVLGMSALDTPDPPRDRSPEAVERAHRFWNAPSRVREGLTRPLLPDAGRGFQYNDVNPTLAAAAVAYAAHASLFDFARQALFDPLGFRNAEWMHQDPTGLEPGGYGLRLRPIDMQKLGNLYLAHGVWNGRQVISRAWVDRSFEPWIRSRPDGSINYGWFWWYHDFGHGWVAHVANGWKGQRIMVFPAQDLVLTTTGCIEDAPEDRVIEEMVQRYVKPSIPSPSPSPIVEDPATSAQLAATLTALRGGRLRGKPGMERRMIPSAEPKERHVRFDGER